MIRYYIVEHTYPARVDTDTLTAESLKSDGSWTADDFLKVTEGGREVDKAEALAFWARVSAYWD